MPLVRSPMRHSAGAARGENLCYCTSSPLSTLFRFAVPSSNQTLGETLGRTAVTPVMRSRPWHPRRRAQSRVASKRGTILTVEGPPWLSFEITFW